MRRQETPALIRLRARPDYYAEHDYCDPLHCDHAYANQHLFEQELGHLRGALSLVEVSAGALSELSEANHV